MHLGKVEIGDRDPRCLVGSVERPPGSIEYSQVLARQRQQIADLLGRAKADRALELREQIVVDDHHCRCTVGDQRAVRYFKRIGDERVTLGNGQAKSEIEFAAHMRERIG